MIRATSVSGLMPHSVRPRLKRHGKDHRPTAFATLLRKGAKIPRDRTYPLGVSSRYSDRLTITIKDPRNDEWSMLGAELANGRGHRHAKEHVRSMCSSA